MLTEAQRKAIIADEIDQFYEDTDVFEDDYWEGDMTFVHGEDEYHETYRCNISWDTITENFCDYLDYWIDKGYLDDDLNTATPDDLENAISYRRFLDRTFTLIANNWLSNIVPNEKCTTYDEFIEDYGRENAVDHGGPVEYEPDYDYDDYDD